MCVLKQATFILYASCIWIGPKAIADAIRDNGALSIANVMGNRIGKEMLSKLQEIMRSKPKLISLCGIADDATEADLSGLGMDADDAIVLASELPDKGALTSLDISKNSIGGYTDYGQRGNPTVSTPGGMLNHSLATFKAHLCACAHRRPCCYRQCHQGYGGVD